MAAGQILFGQSAYDSVWYVLLRVCSSPVCQKQGGSKIIELDLPPPRVSTTAFGFVGTRCERMSTIRTQYAEICIIGCILNDNVFGIIT
jgi:hypothetical protein